MKDRRGPAAAVPALALALAGGTSAPADVVLFSVSARDLLRRLALPHSAAKNTSNSHRRRHIGAAKNDRSAADEVDPAFAALSNAHFRSCLDRHGISLC